MLDAAKQSKSSVINVAHDWCDQQRARGMVSRIDVLQRNDTPAQTILVETSSEAGEYEEIYLVFPNDRPEETVYSLLACATFQIRVDSIEQYGIMAYSSFNRGEVLYSRILSKSEARQRAIDMVTMSDVNEPVVFPRSIWTHRMLVSDMGYGPNAIKAR